MFELALPKHLAEDRGRDGRGSQLQLAQSSDDSVICTGGSFYLYLLLFAARGELSSPLNKRMNDAKQQAPRGNSLISLHHQPLGCTSWPVVYPSNHWTESGSFRNKPATLVPKQFKVHIIIAIHTFTQ